MPDKMNYQLIDNASDLVKACENLQKSPVLACDIEGEWNLHRYGIHLCLMQICDHQQCYLIDPTSVPNLDPLKTILENRNIQKVWHACESDFGLLDHAVSIYPKNIFDTQKALMLLGASKLALADILDEKFNVKKHSKYQRYNWNLRPISQEMLAYAVTDVSYLIELKDILEKDLLKKNRMHWVLEECLALEEIRYKTKPLPKVKGQRDLSLQQLSVMYSLHQEREKLAQNLDIPPFHVFSNKKLIEFSKKPPRTAKSWENSHGLHKEAKKHGEAFINAITESKKRFSPAEIEALRKPDPDTRYMGLDEDKQKLFIQIQDTITKNYPDVAPLILSTKNVSKLSTGYPLTILKKWQCEIVQETAKNLGVVI